VENIKEEMKKIALLIVLLSFATLIWGQNKVIKNDTSYFSNDLKEKPKVKSAWKQFSIENSIPLNSINSDNFSDLQFLTTILENKKYIFLGESSHYVKEFNEIKFRLIRFLFQELDFDVVVFESNIWDCYQLKFLRDNYSSREILDKTIYGVWNTTTLNELISFVVENNIEFAGFDIKPSALKYDYFFEKNVLPQIDSNLSVIAIKCCQEFLKCYSSQNQEQEIENLNQLLVDHQLLLDELDQYIKTNKLDVDLIVYKKEICNRINIISSILIDDKGFTGSNRDSLMAETIEWLIKERYPNKRIIFWGHNGHISKNNRKDEKSMGFMLSDSILNKSYVIGLYMFRGETFSNKIIEIRKPFKNSLEAIMIQPGYKYSFLDFSKVENSESSSWIHQEIPSLLWGRFKRSIILKKTYDGIIFIDKASLPNHFILDYNKKLK